MASFAPPVAPSDSTSYQVEPRVIQNDFGDGYQSRAARGINHMLRRVDIVWSGLRHADADSIVAFFENTGGWQSFTYAVPPETTERRYIAKDWRRNEIAPLASSVSATFEEVIN